MVPMVQLISIQVILWIDIFMSIDKWSECSKCSLLTGRPGIPISPFSPLVPGKPYRNTTKRRLVRTITIPTSCLANPTEKTFGR